MNIDATRPNEAGDIANRGLIRLPLVFLMSLIVGGLLQLTTPLPFVPRSLALPLAVSLVVVAIALFWFSVAKFRAAGTPVPGNKPSTTIVRTGPYRFSRNPIYLAFSVFQLGVAICANSVWLLATLTAAVVLIHYVVIPREEEYLERKFGGQYLD
jgi:Putative protein-S-isoprenylcysteine methyltransferase